MATIKQESHATTDRISVVAMDGDLEWLLMCGSSAMGERGTLAGTINAIESGGGGSGRLDAAGSYIHAYTDQQLGLGSFGGDVERHRWLMEAWRMLEQRTRNILALCYLPARAEQRSDAGYGAKDRWVKEAEKAAGQHGQHRTNIEAQLGEFASLAFALTSNPAYLALACLEPSAMHRKGKLIGKLNTDETTRRRKFRKEAVKMARAESVQAHAEWQEMKRRAHPMRANRDRRAFLPAFQPAQSWDGDEAMQRRVKPVAPPPEERELDLPSTAVSLDDSIRAHLEMARDFGEEPLETP